MLTELIYVDIAKTSEDALKLIKSIIVKSYFKINSHLHLQVVFFFFFKFESGSTQLVPRIKKNIVNN